MSGTASIRGGGSRAAADRFVLPVSGRHIALRHLTGVEDMMLVESAAATPVSRWIWRRASPAMNMASPSTGAGSR